jgi:acyl-CoA-binding protein
MAGKEAPSEESPENVGVESSYQRIVKWIRETPEGPDASASWTVKLRLYGLYKHITAGPLPDDAQPPSVFRFDARAKHEAYAACRSLSRVEAMREYVELVAAEPTQFGQKVKHFLEESRKESFPDPTKQS